MDQSQIEIDVMDGRQLVQRWVCTCAAMPDGAPGVLWRGVLYRLLDGDRIDIGATAEATMPSRTAVLPGEAATWVLVQGMADNMERARAELQRAGVVVERTGRWLGEPVNGVAFDWFLRCNGRISAETVAQALPLARESETRYDAAWQIGELERRVAELLAEQARLQTALRCVQSTPAESTTTLPAAAAELEQELQAAYLRIADLEAASIAPVRLPPTSPPSRLHTELSDLLFALRPDVVLLRDTLRTITIEFASRAVAYQAMGELPPTGGRPEGGKWKALQRVDRWWERHLSDGRSDGARAYARFDAVNRQWQLLIGWKTEQTRDIDWLARQ